MHFMRLACACEKTTDLDYRDRAARKPARATGSGERRKIHRFDLAGGSRGWHAGNTALDRNAVLEFYDLPDHAGINRSGRTVEHDGAVVFELSGEELVLVAGVVRLSGRSHQDDGLGHINRISQVHGLCDIIRIEVGRTALDALDLGGLGGSGQESTNKEENARQE